MDKNGASVGVFAQHYPRVAAIITTRSEDKTNAMTAAWHTPVSYSPPLFAVAISPKRYTYRLITVSKEFAVNFMPASHAQRADAWKVKRTGYAVSMNEPCTPSTPPSTSPAAT